MSDVFIEALSTTVVGMFIVFVILIALSFVLYLLKFLNKEETKVKKPIEENKAKQEIINNLPSKQDDLELVAVITATIASSLGIDSEKLEVRSIKKVENWNSTVRREQQRSII